ncbi:serine hydroxymethyltransferase [soil metagenome]
MSRDIAIDTLIHAEEKRQAETFTLIPSENHVSRQVLDALGSVFTDKYSEGYPRKRYYAGQENTDKVEDLAIERAKQLFGCDHANVQSHSGAQANEAVYHAWLDPGDTVLAMNLGHGGHLTHGHPVTVLARQYNFVRYGMKDIDTGEIDYDQLHAMAKTHKPKIILAGFSAYPRELDYAKFAEIGKETGAVLMADMAHISGLIAGKALANPFDYGFHVMTTTTHKVLRGPRGGMILSNGIVSNPLKKPNKSVDNLPTIIDRTVFPGVQGGPQMHSIAAKAVTFHEALTPEYQAYARQVIANAKRLATELDSRGFKMVTGGTDNHLILLNVKQSFDIDGNEAEKAMERTGLIMNKNAVPDDPLPPFRPSGLRLGTPAITTRGMKEDDMAQIAEWMHSAMKSGKDEKKLDSLRAEVLAETKKFALPSAAYFCSSSNS